MPNQKKSQDGSARGIATATDTLRVEYVADGSSYVEGIVVSARANAAGPTAAQQAGFVRALVHVGRVTEGNTAVTAIGGQDAYSGQGTLIADHLVSLVYQGGSPLRIPLCHRMESGDSITVEVTGAIDSAGAAFDADVSVSIQRRPTSYGVTG